MSDISYRIFLLGRLEVVPCRGRRVNLTHDEPGRLLAYLALHPERAPRREELIRKLWPEPGKATDAKLKGRLRQALHQLRQAIPALEAGSGPLLITTRDQISLNWEACCTDVQEFDADREAALRAATDAERRRLLRLAVRNYGGPLLPGFFDDWVLNRQQQVELDYDETLKQLADLAVRLGERAEAAGWARQWAGVDPLNWERQQYLIGLLADAEGPAAAREQYRRFCERLRREEGEKLNPQLTAFVRERVRQSRASRRVAPPLSSAPVAPVTEGQHANAGGGSAPEAGPTASFLSGRLPPSNLQRQLRLTRFFGREEEMASITQLLTPGASGTDDYGGSLSAAFRLVTLIGPGGIGKTRLALEAAGRLSAGLVGAAWFVPLVQLVDAGRLHERVREEIGIPAAPGLPPLEQLARVFASKPALLLLDNLEQVVPAVVPEIAALLSALPGLRILATSRRRLGLGGEQVFPVEPLPVPVDTASWSPAAQDSRLSPAAERSSPESLPSVQLFIDRARAANPRFQATAANELAIAAVCRHLEGIPLAIELAAARTSLLSPELLLRRLSRRIDVPPSTDPMADPRHVTLRRTIDWSYRLLSPEQQRFFARLSVFHGGWTHSAVEAVADDPNAAPILEQLHAASLIMIAPSACEDAGDIVLSDAAPPPPDWDAPRFRLLEIVREYAAEQLSSEEHTEVRKRHARYYLELAELAEPELYRHNSPAWLHCLETEHDNLRAVLTWSISTPEPQVGARMAAALFWFWYLCAHGPDARNWLDRVMLLEGVEADPVVWARTLTVSGLVVAAKGTRRDLQAPLHRAVRYARHVLQQASAPEDRVIRRLLVLALNHLGQVRQDRGNLRTAETLYRASLTISEELGDVGGVAMGLNDLAQLARTCGDLETAQQLLDRCLPMAQQVGDPWRLAWVLNDLGTLHIRRGRLDEAEAFLSKALSLREKMRATPYVAQSWYELGHLAWLKGDRGRTASYLRSAVRVCYVIGFPSLVMRCLESLAWWAGAEARWQQAVQMFGASGAMRGHYGRVFVPNEQSEHDRWEAAARAALGEAEFAATYEAGRAMTYEQAIALALRDGLA